LPGLSLAYPYPPVRLCSSLRTSPTPACGQELCDWQPHASRYREGDPGRPKFPGNPGAYAVFCDPGGTDTPGRYSVPTWPPDCQSRRLAAGNLSRGSIARREHWLSTLRSAGYPAPRKTRFRLLAKLYRVGLLTHRVPTKGFEGAIVTSSPPFSELHLAQWQAGSQVAASGMAGSVTGVVGPLRHAPNKWQAWQAHGQTRPPGGFYS